MRLILCVVLLLLCGCSPKLYVSEKDDNGVVCYSTRAALSCVYVDAYEDFDEDDWYRMTGVEL